MDLIKRQAAIDAMMAEVDDKDRPNVELRWWNMGLTRASKILEQLPTAEPKTGKWISHSIGHEHIPWGFDCSNCEKWVVIGKDIIKEYKFCPNCGARMGGDAE